MRKLTLLEMVGSSLLVMALAGAASAETVYRWTGADGALAFTDDAKRVPAQYREQAQRTRLGDLAGYARYTPTRAPASGADGALAARLERLRKLNGTGPAEAPVAGAATTAQRDTHTILQLDDRHSIAIPNAQLADGEPVVVEQKRVRDRNNTTTTHLTVVRQGDRILSVVRPESAHDRADWESEREYVGDVE